MALGTQEAGIGRLRSEADLQKWLEDRLRTEFGIVNLHRVAGSLPGGQLSGMAQAVTVLPATANAGDLLVFEASASAGVHWLLRYDGQGSYPWKYLGGPPLVAQDEDSRGLTNQTTYADLPTDPMSIVLPVGVEGDFDVEIAGNIQTASGEAGFLSYAVGATAASDSWSALSFDAVVALDQFRSTNRTRQTGVTAGATIAEKARTGGNYGIEWSRRRLVVWPVRVG